MLQIQIIPKNGNIQQATKRIKINKISTIIIVIWEVRHTFVAHVWRWLLPKRMTTSFTKLRFGKVISKMRKTEFNNTSILEAFLIDFPSRSEMICGTPCRSYRVDDLPSEFGVVRIERNKQRRNFVGKFSTLFQIKFLTISRIRGH